MPNMEVWMASSASHLLFLKMLDFCVSHLALNSSLLEIILLYSIFRVPEAEPVIQGLESSTSFISHKDPYFIQEIWLKIQPSQEILTNFQFPLSFTYKSLDTSFGKIFHIYNWLVITVWTGLLSRSVFSAIILILNHLTLFLCSYLH